MGRRVLLAGLALVLIAGAAESAPARPGPARSRPVRLAPGELLAIPSDPATLVLGADGRLSARPRRLREVLTREGLTRYRAVGRPGVGLTVLSIRSERADFDPRAAAAELMATGAFKAVAPNLTLDLYETVPNDPYLIFQWQIRNETNTDCLVSEAWDVWKGDTSAVIAIMDNGFDVSHPDLASQVWINRAETPGNGVDDDGNGYVDDVKGWDFGDHDNDPSSQPVFDPSGIDIGFHGTFVAGIAAAATNNGLGIAGAGWKCRVMALKVGNAAGDITLEAVTEAFQYLVGEGAAVLNMSFGTADTTAREFFQLMVTEANAANIVCVAAAGNDGVATPAWPAACDGVIAVGATEESGARASFSNYGPWVDVAAPGSLVWSSICQNYPIDDFSQIIYLFFFGWDGENPYMFGDGTSFASPLVAGIAGLVRSKMPSLTPAQVALHLVATGDAVVYDQPIGRRVNALQAVTQPMVTGVGPTAPPGLDLEAPWPNPFGAATTIAFTLPAPAPVRLAVYDASGRRVALLIDATLPAGRHAALWKGRGADGRALGSGVYFATLEAGDARAARKLVLAR